ncbi:MAG: pimeloyl-ACP methyl ester carboxylesterase [Roseivirga sp.]
MKPEVVPSFHLPKYITIPGKVLSTLSTTMATRFALKFFFKPLKLPLPKREENIRVKAERHDLLTKNAKDFIAFELSGPGEKIVLIHGWSGRASQFFQIMEGLNKLGFHIIAIEAPGHGEHLGLETNMLDFVDALEEADSRFGPFHGAIGHSLGGMALFNNMARKAQYEKLVVMGSPASIENVVSDFSGNLKMNEAVTQRLVKTIEERFSINAKESSSDHLCQFYNPHGLIIHDEDDQDVPIINAQQLATKWKKSRLIVSKGLGHRRILMNADLQESIYDFFKI